MFKSIIWATDGSDAADHALPYVKELAATDGASVLVVHSEEIFVGPRTGGNPVHVDEDELKAKIKRQASELGEEGIDVSTKFVSGPTLEGAAHMIADVANDAHPDVIVVGTRGHTQLGGLLLGSVTQRLLHLVDCPVLAVPARNGKH